MGVTHQIFHSFPHYWPDFLNRTKIFLKYASNAQKILTENTCTTISFGLSVYRQVQDAERTGLFQVQGLT